jgi:hypothetical protein
VGLLTDITGKQPPALGGASSTELGEITEKAGKGGSNWIDPPFPAFSALSVHSVDLAPR